MGCKGFVHFLVLDRSGLPVEIYCEEPIGRDLRGLTLSYGASHPKDMPGESVETISLAQLEKYSIFTAFWGEQQAAAAIVAAVCILTRCRA
jgi:hypothetical protein